MDFIHYLPRRVVTRFPKDASDPWFSEVHDLIDGLFQPRHHASRRTDGPTRAVNLGDKIWLISQIHSPWGNLPPGLDACIEVEEITNRNDGTIRFVASKRSRWFPYSDVTAVLAKLITIDARGRSKKVYSNPSLPIGCALQSIRRLESSNCLEHWVEQLDSKTLHFISYRLCDGTRAAFIKAQQLLKENKAIFWDRWSLPRRLAERRELVDNEALDKHVMEQLRRSEIVWGIESQNYAEPFSYSMKEQQEAKRLHRYVAVSPKDLDAKLTAS